MKHFKIKIYLLNTYIKFLFHKLDQFCHHYLILKLIKIESTILMVFPKVPFIIIIFNSIKNSSIVNDFSIDYAYFNFLK
jgi:hypothetical protein